MSATRGLFSDEEEENEEFFHSLAPFLAFWTEKWASDFWRLVELPTSQGNSVVFVAIDEN
jgi:hypothetical protein